MLSNFLPTGLLAVPPDEYDAYRKIRKAWTPFKTIWKDMDATSEEFLVRGNIPLSLTPEFVRDLNGYKTGLKWTTSSRHRDGFLEQLMYMILVECEIMGASSIQIRWSFPRSFSEMEANSIRAVFSKFQNQFGNTRGSIALNIMDVGFSEATTTMKYFLQTSDLFTANQLSASIDIGGGSTDITFFKRKDIMWEDSVKFGGDDISPILHHVRKLLDGYRKDKGGLSPLPDNFDYNKYISTWPGIHRDWSGLMNDFLHSEKYGRDIFFYKLAIFYSSIAYYLGLHLRNAGITEPLHVISFAGNGTQFLRVATNGATISEENISIWLRFFKLMIAAGQGVPADKYTKSNMLFTKDPKKEVAFGMVYENQSPNTINTELKRLLGLNMVLEGVNYDWQSSIPQVGSETVSHCDSISLDLFMDYLTAFDKCAEASNMLDYIGGEIKSNVFTEEYKSQFEDKLRNLLGRRGDLVLASPLFFTASQVWLNDIDSMVKS